MIIETRMTDIVTREQFIDACPAELKKRIDDFFVFYSQKKKSNVFSGPPETGKKFYKDQGKFEKKNNMTSFKKPFEKKVSEFEKALTDFKGILSKLNENNQDVVWTEILDLHLENFLNPNVDEDGWSTVGTAGKKNSNSPADQAKELSSSLYQYCRNCSMYLSQYVELVNRLRKCKELTLLYSQYVDFVMNDLDNLREDNREFNVLTHSICCELYNNGLITKKKFLANCVSMVHERVVKQLSSKKSTDEMMEILVQNITKTGKSLVGTSELDTVRSDLIKWSESKTFSGKIHFNLIDLVELMQSF
jgi:hypothetical protein